MKIYSYVVKHDHGFAPNPFGGVLTLATCKPQIRRTAVPGDWIMGTGSARSVGTDRLVFAAEIHRTMPINEYGRSEKYEFKVPSKGRERLYGDNIYYCDEHSRWIQRTNPFHGSHDIQRDLSGENVLICERFWYFGNRAPKLPAAFRCLVKKGPNHKNNEDHPSAAAFIDWIEQYDAGIIGCPSGLSDQHSFSARLSGGHQAT